MNTKTLKSTSYVLRFDSYALRFDSRNELLNKVIRDIQWWIFSMKGENKVLKCMLSGRVKIFNSRYGNRETQKGTPDYIKRTRTKEQRQKIAKNEKRNTEHGTRNNLKT